MSDAYYIKPERLRTLIEEAQATNAVSEELAVAIEKIARGRFAKAGITDDDDAVQHAVCHVLTKLHMIDTSRNAFSYITAIVWREFLHLRRGTIRDAKIVTKYAERLRRQNQLGHQGDRTQ